MSFFKPRLEVMESRETPTVFPVDPTMPGPSAPPPAEPPAQPALPPTENPPPPPMPEW